MTPRDVQILLVEDDPKDAKLTIHALREENLANNLQVARDGEEALDYLFCQGEFANRNLDHLPQLVLLDLKLPKLDGFEVLRRIRSDPRTRRLPVVILTTSKEEQDLIKGYERGANSYVPKPVEFGEFVNAVKQLGLYWLLLNQNAPLPGRM